MPNATIVTKAYLQELLKNMGFAKTAEVEDALQDILATIAQKAEQTHSHTLSEISDYTAPYTKAETEELIASHTAEQIAKVIADAPESFDTLKELSDWIQEHQDEAGTMNSAISANTQAIQANTAAIATNAQAIKSNAFSLQAAQQNIEEKLQQNQNAQNQQILQLASELSIQIETKANETDVNQKVETINNRLNLMASAENFEQAKSDLQSSIEINAQNIALNATKANENARLIEENTSAINANAENIATITANMVDKRQVMYATGESMTINKTSPTELAVIDLEKGTYLVFVETTITGANYSRAEIFGSHYLLNMPTQGLSIFACKTLSRAKELVITFTPVDNINDNLRTTGTKVTAVKIA